MATKNDTKECPNCKEDVKSEAIKCKHCKSSIEPKIPNHEGVCPICKEDINPEAIKCKHCKSNLVASSRCKCSSSEEDDITKIQAQLASMSNIRPAASSFINRNSGVELPTLNCTYHCFWGPNGLICYFLCEGPIETSFANRLSTF